MQKNRNESGFTLLEIALVLLVAGLLIGAVMNSRGISESAKSFKLQKQVQELIVAVELYHDRMAALPTSGSPDWANELYDEELITSPAKAMSHPFGDDIEFFVDSAPANHPYSATEDATYFRYDNVPAKWASALLYALDDGDNPEVGFIRATATGSVTTALDRTQLNTAMTDSDEVHVFVRY